MAKKTVKPASASNTAGSGERASATPAPSDNTQTEWRDHLKVHPACERFDPLTPTELQELANDIKANGLRDKIKVVRRPRKRPDGSIHIDDYDWVVIDGRNRLDAMELAGVPIFKAGNKPNFDNFYDVDLEHDDEIVTFIISVNIKRRHLSQDQRDRIIADLIKLNPTKSNRQIAGETGTSHPKVGRVRAKLEAAGGVEQTYHVDTKGRHQPAHKPPTARQRADRWNDEQRRKAATAPATASQPLSPPPEQPAEPERSTPLGQLYGRLSDVYREVSDARTWEPAELTGKKLNLRLRNALHNMLTALSDIRDIAKEAERSAALKAQTERASP